MTQWKTAMQTISLKKRSITLLRELETKSLTEAIFFLSLCSNF